MLDLVGDVDFTPTERQWVEEAERELAIQTNGFVRVRTVFALDFHDQESLASSAGSDVLVKIDRNAPPVVEFDGKHCCLLGLTQRRDFWQTIYLVTDRMEQIASIDQVTYRTMFISVTMHEMLHALGLRHVDDPRALMAASLESGVTTSLTRSDYLELCREWACSVRRASGGRYGD